MAQKKPIDFKLKQSFAKLNDSQVRDLVGLLGLMETHDSMIKQKIKEKYKTQPLLSQIILVLMQHPDFSKLAKDEYANRSLDKTKVNQNE